ncbi:MAG: PTS acetylgalactosamine transporter subunit IIC [Clostridiales bacterium]|nr:MAG: PTS acetylgalactosamine transporter subunit IIC [Clostridiales bacterium]
MSFIQYALIIIVTFIAAIDQFNFLESLYQPIVVGPIVGAILGDAQTGLVVGASYQLMQIGSMPVGGAQPPNAVIGGIMATVFAVRLNLTDPQAALGLAIPFALLGQYAVTLLFTVMSPIMAKADKYAKDANPKGIVKINYFAMGVLGLLFSVAVLIGLVGGEAAGKTLATLKGNWVMGGLGAAGGMMRYVGFAILMKIMLSNELWGFYFGGFALATILASAGLGGPALLLIAIIGFGIAYYDYQANVKLKNVGMTGGNGGEADGI